MSKKRSSQKLKVELIPLCPVEEVKEGQSKGFSISESSIFIVNKHSRLFGYRNECPHLGVPLEWQADDFLDTESELIQCSTHGALFTIDTGLCVSGPCVNQHLSQIVLKIDDGYIYWLKK